MMKLTHKIIGMFCAIALISCTNTSTGESLFNEAWEFNISDASYEQIMTEENWESVSLPHTPVIESKVMDGQWQGISWYRKTFNIPASAKNQRLILRFDGAMNASEFWVNGSKVASHLGGYLPVVFDFTETADFGGENTILVRLDNTDNLVTGPKPMRNLDFNMFGGLYRDAFLIVENALHITDPVLADKPAGGGIFVSYPKVEQEEAIVDILCHVINQDAADRSFTIENELWEGSELIASSTSELLELLSENDTEVSAQLTVSNPKLWSPSSPNLYTLKTMLISKGKEVDLEETRIGIRRIEIIKGSFRINGEEQFLRGVNRHQEYPYVGYALSNEAQYRDALRIKEAGFDYIRLSHYPHSPAFMDACDKLGLVVTDAILGWQYYSKDPAFQAQIYNTSRDLIRRDRNHACVIAWEVSLNESWMDSAFIDQLTSIAHEEYPGDQCYTAGWQKYGYDIYLQARQHRLKHYRETEKPYSVSEYGDWEYYAMNAGLNQDNWGDLLQADRSSRQLLSDGEVRLLQQATNIQEAHNDNFSTPAFSDSYWVMYDYNRGYSNDLEASGIMSIDRVPKFSYYFYTSQRDADEYSDLYSCGPMVKIASWWTEESPLELRVFSNCDKVELLVNGVSLGKHEPDVNSISMNLAHPPFSFGIEKFEAGELVARAFLDNELVVIDTVRTPGSISKISLTTELSERSSRVSSGDLIFVYASLVDENGTVVRVNDKEVKFEIEGDAMLVSPEVIATEAGIASAMVKVGIGGRSITIKAVMGEKESAIAINSSPK
jgi:beta-galactosidase